MFLKYFYPFLRKDIIVRPTTKLKIRKLCTGMFLKTGDVKIEAIRSKQENLRKHFG